MGDRRRAIWRGMLVLAGVLVLYGAWAGLHVARAHSALRSATDEVSAARAAASAGHIDEATAHAARAEAAAHRARGAIGGLTFRVLTPLPWVGRQVSAARDLADVAVDLTRDGHALLAVAAASPLAADDGGGSLPGVGDLTALSAQLDPVRGPLARLHATVTHASATVTKLEDRGLVGPLSRVVDKLGTQLTAAGDQLAIADAGAALARRGAETGPPMRLLLLAQDTWELRPSGGFIGSYGILEIGNGKLHLAHYDDATTLPYPATPLRPPEPLGSNLDHPWSLTGAGWWPSFPTSAYAAERLFLESGGGSVDGVVATTQQFLEDLLRGLGTKLTVPGYPDVITPANVAERILYNVELKRPLDVPRKRFLTRLTTELFDHLETVKGARARKALSAIGTAFRARHLQITFNDPALQRSFEEAGYTGVIVRPPHSDLFATADADFGADKATRYVKRKISYTVSRNHAGRLVADVVVDTNDFGPKLPTNEVFIGYLRVYAPRGATLVDAARHQVDIRSDVETGLQAFGLGQAVRPGTTKSRHVVYYLPDDVVRGGVYRLLVRPQAGTPDDTITVRLDLGGPVLTKTFRAADGDQTLTARVHGTPRARPPGQAPDRAWQSVPTVHTPAECTLEGASLPPLPANASEQEIRDRIATLQRAIQPQVDALLAKGCEQVNIHRGPPG